MKIKIKDIVSKLDFENYILTDRYKLLLKGVNNCHGYCPCVPKHVRNDNVLCPCKEYRRNRVCQCGMFESVDKEES